MNSELIHSTSKIRSHLFNVQCHSKCVSTFVMVAIRPPLHRELPVVFSSRNAEILNSTCSTCSLASCGIESLSHGSAARKTVIFCRRYFNVFSRTTSIWHWESRPITENLFTSNKRLFCNAANVMPVLASNLHYRDLSQAVKFHYFDIHEYSAQVGGRDSESDSGTS